MKTFAAILFALLLTCGIARAATSLYAGYIYPSNVASNECSPLCTSASLPFVIPNISYSGTGATEGILPWLGIAGDNNATCGSNQACLGQFGVAVEVTTGGSVSCYAWYELFPIQGIQQISNSFPCAVGDHMIATMVCSSNCTAYNASQTWTVTLRNVTQSWTWNNGNTDFNWPLGMARVYAIAESNGNYQGCGSPCRPPSFPPTLFGPWTINGAAPAINPAVMLQNGVSSSPIRYTIPSGPLGSANGGGNYFNVCSGTVSTLTCGNAAYTGNTVGAGP